MVATPTDAIKSLFWPRTFFISILKHAFRQEGTLPDSIFGDSTNPIELARTEY